MEQLIFKIIELSPTLGLAFFMIWIFIKKLDERDTYIKELVKDLRTIIEQDNAHKEALNNSLREVKKEVEILNDKIDNLL